MIKKVVSVAVALITALALTTTAYASDNVLDSITAGAAKKVKIAFTSSSDGKTSGRSASASKSTSAKSKSSGGMQIIESGTLGERKGVSEDADTDEEDGTESASEAEETRDVPDSSDFELCVADVDDMMNVRADASEDASVVGYLYKDCVGEILERGDGWTRIRSGELEGWAKDEFLIFGDEAKKKTDASVMEIAVVNADGLRIRAEATEDSEVKAVLAIDDVVDVIETEDEWTKISYQDGTEGEDTGYVSNEYITIKTTYKTGETLSQVKEREEKSKAAREESAKQDKDKKDDSKKSDSSSENKSAEPKSDPVVTNNGGVDASVDDETLLAALIQCECNGPYEAQLAVGAVVVNRAKSGYGSISNAIYAPYQFGPASSGKLKLTLSTGAVSATAKQAAHDAISGVSNVGNAKYFRNVSSGHAGIVIGNHVYW